jgi:hypothetical protein
MKNTLSIPTVLCALLCAGGSAYSQEAAPDVCRLPNSTVIHVTMANGSIVQFLLERNGSSMQGMAVFERGKGPVTGEFSGQYLYWDVAWDDGSQASFRGQLSRGQGAGTATHSSNRDVSINWTARTPDGCARWPDVQTTTPNQDTKSGAPAQLFAAPQASAPAPVQKSAPAKANAPAAAVQTAPRVQARAASNAAQRPTRECPSGSVRADNGDCVQPARPSLLLPLPMLGIGGIGISIGR